MSAAATPRDTELHAPWTELDERSVAVARGLAMDGTRRRIRGRCLRLVGRRGSYDVVKKMTITDLHIVTLKLKITIVRSRVLCKNQSDFIVKLRSLRHKYDVVVLIVTYYDEIYNTTYDVVALIVTHYDHTTITLRQLRNILYQNIRHII